MSYNLRKKTLEFEYQYRKDVVERTGLILIGQDRVMTRDGRVLSFSQALTLNDKSEPGADDRTLVIKRS
ncbi:MAG TPA: hypothetical protein ENN66_00330 [Proteobacteria bacterium]|nr:hypothetical protein [Pseudomonadota bacterium]